MKIKFKVPVKTEAKVDICCFDGDCRHQVWEFDAGEILEVKNIIWGEARKTKSRPGVKGGRFRHCDLILTGKNENTIHPDYISGIPESVFEVIDETPIPEDNTMYD